MVGALIAQLFRLQPSPNPDPVLGYFVLGIPLAAVFICAAIVVTVLGAWRFWRQQNAMVRGKIHAGGWEILVIMVGSLLVSSVSVYEETWGCVCGWRITIGEKESADRSTDLFRTVCVVGRH